MAIRSVKQRHAPQPLVAHVVFRFDYGGLENGIVNLINRMPNDAFTHCVIALTEASDFQKRIEKPGVAVHCIRKRPGKDPVSYFRIYRLFRKLRPAIVHTRNLGTIECLLLAWLAGAPVRIHGEHGWDIYDRDGTSTKYRMLRRLILRLADRVVTVSEDLAVWLTTIGIPEEKVTRICNGVDTEKFYPREKLNSTNLPASVPTVNSIVVGTITRFAAIKDPLNLVKAFISVRSRHGQGESSLSLLMIGSGELHNEAKHLVEDAAIQDLVWLPGSRDDTPEILRSMDLFVLGSLREGISNTVLEAMATGLPVIATATGGNLELVTDGVTGRLVPPADPEALADAIMDYVADADKRERHGRAAREKAVSKFSLCVMVENYLHLYSDALQRARV